MTVVTRFPPRGTFERRAERRAQGDPQADVTEGCPDHHAHRHTHSEFHAETIAECWVCRQNIHAHTTTAAIAATASAMSAAGTAWRVRRTATAPKYTAST